MKINTHKTQDRNHTKVANKNNKRKIDKISTRQNLSSQYYNKSQKIEIPLDYNAMDFNPL